MEVPPPGRGRREGQQAPPLRLHLAAQQSLRKEQLMMMIGERAAGDGHGSWVRPVTTKVRYTMG